MTAAVSSGPGYEVRHMLAAEAGKLSGLLAENLPVGIPMIRSLIDIGAVYIDRVRASPGSYDVVVSKGAYLRVHLQVECFSFFLSLLPKHDDEIHNSIAHR
jgi:hypothetical protein